MNKSTLTQEEKDEIWRKKILKELEDIIIDDWGDECEVWNEECAKCQAQKALTVLKNLYGYTDLSK
jgi:hypothetical protein